MKIYKEFTFDSAHYLPNVEDGHPCKRMHGHTYKLRIWIKGKVDEEKGWLVDFGDIKKIIKPLVDSLDHRCLNDIEGLENPTSENLCVWIWKKIKPQIPGLCEVAIYETPSSGAVYEGD
jgi:6-pyruvoyltetrahydropterin/6-carboxytetrahydropterin synthase